MNRPIQGQEVPFTRLACRRQAAWAAWIAKALYERPVVMPLWLIDRFRLSITS